MKRTILMMILALSTNLTIFAQTKNYIYQGDKQYESTDTWKFDINGTTWVDSDLEVTIGKDGSSGIVMLQTEVTPQSYIGGPVYLFLSDGSKITCTDKNIKDNVDNKTVVIYKVTAEEVARLKEYYITSIRFTIQPTSHGMFNGNKTAENKIMFSYGSNKSYYETNVAVTELFNN